MGQTKWAVLYKSSGFDRWAGSSDTDVCVEGRGTRWTTAVRSEAIVCCARCRDTNGGANYCIVRICPRSPAAAVVPEAQGRVVLAFERIADRLDDLLAALPTKRELAAILLFASAETNTLEGAIDGADELIAELERTAK